MVNICLHSHTEPNRTERSSLCSPVPAAALALFAAMRNAPEVCPHTTPNRNYAAFSCHTVPSTQGGPPGSGQGAPGALPLPEQPPDAADGVTRSPPRGRGQGHGTGAPRPCHRPALGQSRPTPGSAGTRPCPRRRRPAKPRSSGARGTYVVKEGADVGRDQEHPGAGRGRLPRHGAGGSAAGSGGAAGSPGAGAGRCGERGAGPAPSARRELPARAAREHPRQIGRAHV